MKWNLFERANRVYEQERNPDIEVNSPHKAELEIAQDYFLPAFFAAQKAFNLADNLALVAELTFFLAFTAGLTESVAGLARRRFARRVF